MSFLAETVDVIIVGAGHAGCEAALAAARMGLKTILFSISLDAVALMPCNPSIGGSSKGHLVREIDALGGEMGINIDHTYLQSKMLNRGKGPAVHSPRAQADKFEYAKRMKQTIENTDNLWLRQGEVQEILVKDGRAAGVVTTSGAAYHAKAVVLCTGTYLNARCLYGETIVESGPNGLKASHRLTENLKSLGIDMFRFKTGTPARVDKKSIDFSKMEIQWGDEEPSPFSFTLTKEDIKRDFVPCYLTYTNEKTHEIIKNNLHRSPMYAGVIEGTGTRYCPSIEDKIVRFADKNRHQLFIEPEGEHTQEMYIQGMSTSLPEDVQIQMYQSIPGLENCRIMRTAYAIEYNCIDATQLTVSLEFKKIKGLFAAGQFNGSSGYEEAAAQGLIAGINAANYVLKKEPFILTRSDGYIGVLIDDLVTKGTKEPYRMMTSRSEYRLLLRQDNADIRLTPLGYQQGLISQVRYDKLQFKISQIEQEIKRLQSIIIAPKEETTQFLAQYNSSLIQTGVSMIDLIKRPELSYQILQPLDPERLPLEDDIAEQVNIQIKYEGYINRQKMQVAQFKKMENKLLPENFDYAQVQGLRLEAVQKLNAIQPKNVGHASRITGVSPADISVLFIYLGRN